MTPSRKEVVMVNQDSSPLSPFKKGRYQQQSLVPAPSPGTQVKIVDDAPSSFHDFSVKTTVEMKTSGVEVTQ
jgi:hypothetical protein